MTLLPEKGDMCAYLMDHSFQSNVCVYCGKDAEAWAAEMDEWRERQRARERLSRERNGGFLPGAIPAPHLNPVNRG